MLSILSISLLLSHVVARPSSSILQPLPKGYDAGDAGVVFLKDRLNVLPEGFRHHEEGMFLLKRLIQTNHSLAST
jgi:hypothetical protein